ncbi:MAG: methyltransferase domain-containing protein [Nocardioides sp.]|nr:methyltransferase domain-containing protein [Nocardioidaceae bacterium]MCB8956641.1 methyltransferase domain-containing protein [Nocardioides sp.]
MTARVLDLDHWDRATDRHDEALLDLCVGPTLDVGCGPGRLAAGLAARGHVVLGIDVLGRAVGTAVRRGATALRRDVFDALPGEGRWSTALLADGNVGIGGDPTALLRRVRELLGPDGRVVAELAPPGTPLARDWAVVRAGTTTSAPFRWAVVGVDDIDALAVTAGLLVGDVARLGERWCAVLEAA